MPYGWGDLALDAMGRGARQSANTIGSFFGSVMNGAAGTSPTPSQYTARYGDLWASDPTYSHWKDASNEEKDTIYGARNFGVDQKNENTLGVLGKYGFNTSGKHLQEIEDETQGIYARNLNTNQGNRLVPGPKLDNQPLPVNAPPPSPTDRITSITSGANTPGQNMWNINELAKAIAAKYAPQYDDIVNRIKTAKNPYDTNTPEFRSVLSGAHDRVASQMGRSQAALDQSLAARGALGSTLADVSKFGQEMAGRKAQALTTEQIYANALNNYNNFEQQRNRDLANTVGLGMNAEMTGMNAIAGATKEAYNFPMMVNALNIKNQLDQITLDDASMTADTRRARINAENQAVIDAIPWQTSAQKVQFENAVAQGKVDKGIIDMLGGMEPSLALAIITGTKFMAAAAPAAVNVALSGKKGDA